MKTRIIGLALAAGLAMGAATPVTSVAPPVNPTVRVILPMGFNACNIPLIGWILCPGR